MNTWGKNISDIENKCKDSEPGRNLGVWGIVGKPVWLKFMSKEINRKDRKNSQEQGHTKAWKNFGYCSKGDRKSLKGFEQRVI